MERPRHPRILVVDDDPVIRATLEEGLLRRGFNVQVAQDAVEALQVALSRPVDLVILDYELPDRNGDVVYEALRQIRPELAQRTLFISGSVSRERIPAGCPFLPKPFRIGQVAKLLRRLLRSGTELAEPRSRDWFEDSLDPEPA